jgi:hypothetical protein
MVATFVPGIGGLAALADAGLYAFEGDYMSAALALTGLIPGGRIAGMAGSALKSAAKGLSFATKAGKAGLGKLGSLGGKVLGKLGKDGFGGLSRAREFGIDSYKSLRTALKGTELQAHHLIEQRFAKTLALDAKEMLSVAVTKEEHQAFTNAWRAAIKYGADGTGKATRDEIMDAAKSIYANHPDIPKALGL